MKKIIIFMGLLVGVAAHSSTTMGADDAGFTCHLFEESSEYSLNIEVSYSNVKILQSSRVGRFASIQFAVQPSRFSESITEPDFSCQETREKYSIRILVKNGTVQVLQSAPNARFAPLQFEATN